MPASVAPAPVSRRRLLQASGASAAVIALGIRAPQAQAETAPQPEGLFSLGVACGAPRPDGMVLWTRLAPEPLAEDGHGGMEGKDVTVRWHVAKDPEFRQITARGQALAQPALAHAVHPRVEGLEPATDYFYRFSVGRQNSPVGRFRTLPAEGAEVESFSVGVVSCQAWYHGHFTAHKHLAAEEELDLVVFVGDYIYEYGITESNLWRQAVEVGPAHQVEAERLEQYRLRYALFKSDPHLQAVHARVPAVAVWDDHEVQNDYLGGSSSTGVPDDLFAHRIAVAYRAFYENMPLDLEALPDGPDSDITTGFDVGNLARLTLLDTRQFRDPAPTDPEDQQRPERSMLGAEQEEWASERLADSPATWNILANGVVVAAITEDRVDMWDGYPAARQRLLEAMAGASNPVVLTGDIHKHVATELLADFSDPGSGTVGVELICTSVGSDGDGAKTDAYTPDWLQHEYVKHYDGRRGYLHLRLTPEELVSSFYIVEWVEADDTAPKLLSARFTTPAGDSRLIPA
ncbi:alkaline phosphatase D family protein [Brachybacterium alimentarium]|uniref:alkaline phosphatase D family protein n=1 Tax=Brachybacterium alimentarium TaxID=47845 RepID=UPI000DF278AD|nr:alkaline phosphatase D family protein [Brachybacterium alimentarium]RCS65302.1 alkaline phosphatase [Brachybacterium alimentarium]RCS87833.1 alkaline phosphatase [Brachybacterium alimentarium]